MIPITLCQGEKRIRSGALCRWDSSRKSVSLCASTFLGMMGASDEVEPRPALFKLHSVAHAIFRGQVSLLNLEDLIRAYIVE